MVFAGYSSFLHQLQLPGHDLPAIWQKSDKKNHTKFQIPFMDMWHCEILYILLLQLKKNLDEYIPIEEGIYA